MQLTVRMIEHAVQDSLKLKHRVTQFGIDETEELYRSTERVPVVDFNSRSHILDMARDTKFINVLEDNVGAHSRASTLVILAVHNDIGNVT